MRIIVDCMSGDNAPEEIVKGACLGAKLHNVEVLLVGKEEIIKKIISDNGLYTKGVEISACDGENLTMEDEPGAIMKEKKDSSMAKAMLLLKEGAGDALVSAGNTGALLTGATLIIRRIKGVRRAALGAIIPMGKPMLLVDSGAQTDASPENLLQYALLGNMFMEKVMHIENPKIGLINNGAEEHKGTELYRQTHALLKNSSLNFIGNIEGRDVPMCVCDIIVADGFTGNILLKLCEGAGIFVKKTLKNIFYKNTISKLSALLVKGNLSKLKKDMDYSEHGGAPFLGIAKPVIKAHGSSNAKSIAKCIEQAKNYAESGIIDEFANMSGAVAQE